MTRFAEHLIDEVLPIAPVRQWVLTVPYRVRYRMAYDHALCREVHRAFTRALLLSYRHRAAARGIAHGQTGAVTCIQRFGSALNLNPHFHTQAIDGVFVEQHGGRPEWSAPLRSSIQRFLTKTGNNPGAIRASGQATGDLSEWSDWETPTLQ